MAERPLVAVIAIVAATAGVVAGYTWGPQAAPVASAVTPTPTGAPDAPLPCQEAPADGSPVAPDLACLLSSSAP